MSKMLFICGFPSGGTDLTRTVLNAHPDIDLAGEMLWLPQIARHGYDRSTTFSDIEDIRRFQGLLRRLDRWHNLPNLSHDFRLELDTKGTLPLEEVLRICQSSGDAEVWGNKTPQNTERIDALLELFPDAHFLIVTRDVRDVCLSWARKWGKNMLWCAAKWADRMAKGKRATSNISEDRCLFVKFEDLLSSPEVTCARICAFLDLPFSNRMLEHNKHTREILPGKVNYGQPIKMSNFGKWKKEMTAATTKRIEEIAYDTMKTFGYEVEYAACQRPISSFEMWRGKCHDGWAMLTVGNRYHARNSFRLRLKTVFDHLYWRIGS